MTTGRDGIDAVYMLMFPGWETELRSNRWHFASRWARRLPVVLVQPDDEGGAGLPRSVPEPRIPNCRILRVAGSQRAHTYATDVARQTAAVLADMAQANVARPLLWFYNPQLAGLYARLPAACRLFHATENYFHFGDATEFFLSQVRFALRISDLVVAVSAGVAASIAREAPAAEVHVVTNGCDYKSYAGAAADPALQSLRDGFSRVGIYAGNINRRLDFELLRRCANDCPDILFAFYGPVARLGWRDRRHWRALAMRANVRHFGAVDADRLPALYSAADVGLIPYRADRLIVENGFPLKALEMGAAGLPVVSSFMKPLAGLASALQVCRDADEFVGAVRRLDRGSLDERQREEMRVLCTANDYDGKFDAVAGRVAARSAAASVRSLRPSEIPASLGGEAGEPSRPARLWLRGLLSAMASGLPGLGARMPASAKRRLKNWLERP